MNGPLKKLFARATQRAEAEPLGEDMAPSPLTLAERVALSTKTEVYKEKSSGRPFSSAARAPLRDFTG